MVYAGVGMRTPGMTGPKQCHAARIQEVYQGRLQSPAKAIADTARPRRLGQLDAGMTPG